MAREDFVTCVQVLNALIHADDKVTDEETALLERVMDEMKFTDEERARVADEKVDLKAGTEIMKGLSRPIRVGLFKTMVNAARADGHVDERESKFIVELAVSVDIEEAEALRLLEKG